MRRGYQGPGECLPEAPEKASKRLARRSLVFGTTAAAKEGGKKKNAICHLSFGCVQTTLNYQDTIATAVLAGPIHAEKLLAADMQPVVDPS